MIQMMDKASSNDRQCESEMMRETRRRDVTDDQRDDESDER